MAQERQEDEEPLHTQGQGNVLANVRQGVAGMPDEPGGDCEHSSLPPLTRADTSCPSGKLPPGGLSPRRNLVHGP